MPTYSPSETYSVKERIVQNVVTTLQGITQANGFYFNVGAVRRFENNPHNEPALPALGVVGIKEKYKNLAGSPALLDVRLFVTVTGLVANDPADDSEQQQNFLVRDVIAALMYDRTRGGLAVSTDITDTDFEILESEKPLSMCSVVIEINYRCRDTDPTKKY